MDVIVIIEIQVTVFIFVQQYGSSVIHPYKLKAAPLDSPLVDQIFITSPLLSQ